MKKYLLSLLLASKLLASDSTNAPTLDITPQQININSTATLRVYSLLENPNLLEDNWTEVESKRGNDSNLTFLVNQELPQNFYKVRADYMPYEPNSTYMEYYLSYAITQRGQGPGTTFSNNLMVVNYDSTNKNITVNFEELYHWYPFSAYTVNAPYNKTLHPGTNYLPLVFIWQCNDGGAQVWGNWNIVEQQSMNSISQEKKSEKR